MMFQTAVCLSLNAKRQLDYELKICSSAYSYLKMIMSTKIYYVPGAELKIVYDSPNAINRFGNFIYTSIFRISMTAVKIRLYLPQGTFVIAAYPIWFNSSSYLFYLVFRKNIYLYIFPENNVVLISLLRHELDQKTSSYLPIIIRFFFVILLRVRGND